VNRITLTFFPENESDQLVLAGLSPFLKEMHSPWFL